MAKPDSCSKNMYEHNKGKLYREIDLLEILGGVLSTSIDYCKFSCAKKRRNPWTQYIIYTYVVNCFLIRSNP